MWILQRCKLKDVRKSVYMHYLLQVMQCIYNMSCCTLVVYTARGRLCEVKYVILILSLVNGAIIFSRVVAQRVRLLAAGLRVHSVNLLHSCTRPHATIAATRANHDLYGTRF